MRADPRPLGSSSSSRVDDCHFSSSAAIQVCVSQPPVPPVSSRLARRRSRAHER
jgi:hypothetical protein